MGKAEPVSFHLGSTYQPDEITKAQLLHTVHPLLILLVFANIGQSVYQQNMQWRHGKFIIRKGLTLVSKMVSVDTYLKRGIVWKFSDDICKLC